jgi:death on curing protein
MEIIFLDYDDILDLHERLIRLLGGIQGIRDEGLLRSAIAQPEAGFGDEYFHKDLFEMAAAYVFHIILNHPFLDGNKRTGWMAGSVFLELNDVILKPAPSQFDAEVMSLAVAEGKADKNMIADFFRKYSEEIQP